MSAKNDSNLINDLLQRQYWLGVLMSYEKPYTKKDALEQLSLLDKKKGLS